MKAVIIQERIDGEQFNYVYDCEFTSLFDAIAQWYYMIEQDINNGEYIKDCYTIMEMGD